MSVLELKGGLLNMIAQVEEEHFLKEMYVLFQDKLNGKDWFMELPKAIQADLELALQESEQQEQLVSHEEAIKTINAWL